MMNGRLDKKENLSSFWNEKHLLYDNIGDIQKLTNTSLRQIKNRFNLNQYLTKRRTILMIGVGTGKDTKELVSKGHIVDGYDISEVALTRLKNITRCNYLVGDKQRILFNEYDLIISHFVAQHMNNFDLRDQIVALMPCLSKKGFFALQFVDIKNPHQQTEQEQKGGGCSRTLQELQELIPQFKITLVNQKQYNKNVNGLYVYIYN